MSSETSFPLGPLSPREQNRDIVWMMLPLLAVSCYLYGARPAVMCLVGSITAAFCDRLVAWLRGRPHDRTENSSIPAVLVMLMLMPATLSYYIVVITSMTVVLVAKAPFGGYGHYPFNPSAVGYAVAAVSWPSQVFTYPVPFTTMSVFSTAEATMVESAAHSLQAGGTPNVRALNLVLGNYAGPMGTTVLLVILACALFLIHRRRMGLVAPLCFIFACAFMAFFFPRLGDLAFAAPWEHLLERLDVVKYEICTGGVLFAAVFLINDPVTLPKSNASRAVYGLVLGVATMLFRYYGTYETGVCFALLAVGAVSGWMDRAVQRAIHHKGVVRREY